MNDFSNVLWAYGGDYFDNGPDVGRYGSDDPGEPLLDRPESIEGAEMYRKLVVDRPPRQQGLGLDRAGRGVHGRRVRDGRRSGTSSPPASSRRRSPARSATRASRAARSAARTCTAARASASTASRRSASRRPRGCSSTGRRRPRRSCPTSRARSAAGRRRASRSTSCRRSRRRASRRRRCRTSSRRTPCSRRGSPRTSGCGRRSRPGTSATPSSSPSCRRCWPARQSAEECMRNAKDGFEGAIERAAALRKQ